MLETIWESRWLPDIYGGVAQLGEHLPCKQGVMSSNLTISTFKLNKKEQVKSGHSPVWRAKASLCHSVASPLIQLLSDPNVKASFPVSSVKICALAHYIGAYSSAG